MIETVIVSDTSPLIGLARIRKLNLLREMSARVVVPRAVWDEVVAGGPNAAGVSEIVSATWIEIIAPPPAAVDPLRILVDRGEAESMALAMSIAKAVLLVDDARARRLAQRLGIARIGSVGLLRRAKQMGLIARLKPELEALQANGIYMSKQLFDEVLKSVGE